MATEPQIVYQNVQVQNNTGQSDAKTAPGYPIVAEYNEQRTSPFLTKASDYLMSIVRLVVPTSEIPILIMNAKNPYIVALEVGGQTFTQTVTYIPAGTEQIGFIYDYQTMLININNALKLAQVAALAAGAALLTEAPGFCFTPESGLFYLRALKGAFYPEVATSGVIATSGCKVWVNDTVLNLFQSIPAVSYGLSANLTSGKVYNILVQDCLNNSIDTTHWKISQTSVSLSLWNVSKTLVVTSPSMPIVPEFVGGSNTSLTGTPTLRIISDFAISDQAAAISTSYLVYTPAEFRYTDLVSDQPLSNLNLTVSWQDAQGTNYPLYVGLGKSFSIKFMFIKKNSHYAAGLITGKIRIEDVPGYGNFIKR